MSYDVDGVSGATELELRADVEPLEKLLDERTNTVRKLAPLWALYGPGSSSESRLSSERSRIVGLLRAMAVANGEKITEAALEAGSRAHPDYIGFMAKMTTDRTEFYELEQKLHAIDFRLNRGQAILRAYASEVRT